MTCTTHHPACECREAAARAVADATADLMAAAFRLVRRIVGPDARDFIATIEGQRWRDADAACRAALAKWKEMNR